MATLRESMRWRGIPIGATAAWGETELLLGEVGAGGPGMLIAAGIHGDEGPLGAVGRSRSCWSAWMSAT